MMTDYELGWLAGIFEGEGCVSVTNTSGPSRKQRQWSAIVNMTDEDVVRRFHRTVGIGSVRPEPHPPHKTSWRWKIARQEDVLNFCALLGPHMGTRRMAKMLTCLSDTA
jgi:hypothetical protein